MEKWKDVPGLDGVEVSSDGIVRKTIKKTRKTNGYELVTLRDGDCMKQFLVHRLVAAAFLGLNLSDRSAFVCHKDDNPLNNTLENLFLGNAKINSVNTVDKGRDNPPRKLSEELIIEMRQKRANGCSLKTLVQEYGISKGHASKICNGIVW